MGWSRHSRPRTVFRGGASFTGRGGGRLNITSPFAHLTLSATLVRLDIAPRWVRAAAMALSRNPSRADRGGDWSTSWSDLDRIVIARRSVAFLPKHGSPFRFVTAPASVKLIGQTARSAGCRVDQARTTIKFSYRLS